MTSSDGAKLPTCRPPEPVSTPATDTDARYGNQRSTTWTGYQVPVTKTCDADAPHRVVKFASSIHCDSNLVKGHSGTAAESYGTGELLADLQDSPETPPNALSALVSIAT